MVRNGIRLKTVERRRLQPAVRTSWADLGIRIANLIPGWHGSHIASRPSDVMPPTVGIMGTKTLGRLQFFCIPTSRDSRHHRRRAAFLYIFLNSHNYIPYSSWSVSKIMLIFLELLCEVIRTYRQSCEP